MLIKNNGINSSQSAEISINQLLQDKKPQNLKEVARIMRATNKIIQKNANLLHLVCKVRGGK